MRLMFVAFKAHYVIATLTENQIFGVFFKTLCLIATLINCERSEKLTVCNFQFLSLAKLLLNRPDRPFTYRINACGFFGLILGLCGLKYNLLLIAQNFSAYHRPNSWVSLHLRLDLLLYSLQTFLFVTFLHFSSVRKNSSPVTCSTLRPNFENKSMSSILAEWCFLPGSRDGKFGVLKFFVYR